MVSSNKYQQELNESDGSKQYSKTIQNESEKYFTKEIMEQLEESSKNFLMDQTRFSKVKYRYVQHIRYEHDLILIDEGQFKDVQYVYGNVKFIEEEGQLRIKFDYTVILNLMTVILRVKNLLM